MPANLANLSHRLPKANYATLQSEEVSIERMPLNSPEAMHASQTIKGSDIIGASDGLRASTDRNQINIQQYEREPGLEL